MCGIVGFYHSERPVEGFPETVRRMLAAIRHRGPDEMGYYYDTRMALGAARLSIIDLASGQQPISDETERYWIAYNGEVYNYLELRDELVARGVKFKTRCDTEVVLQAWIAWGEQGLARLNGGFAFAIYDRLEDVLVLVRDKYGKRPLFYTRLGGELVFGSEIKSFLAHGGVDVDFDAAQLASMFTVWTPLPHQSGYKDIHQVPGGSYLIARKGRIEIREYYTLSFRADPWQGSLEEAAERTRDELSQAVRLRLRSDVEVGTYLSGGLDSSITTLLAVRHSRHKVRSFSIAFDEKEFDESQDQDHVSAFLGTAHCRLAVSNDDIAAAFPDALWHAEVPVFRTAFVPMFLLSRRVREEGIKVVLTGEGADEAFVGYEIFKETVIRENWNTALSMTEKVALIRRLYPYLKHFTDSPESLVALYDRYAVEKRPRLFSHEVRFDTANFATRLLAQPQDGYAAICAYLAEHDAEIRSLPGYQKAQWLEYKTLLMGYLLSTQGDRVSFGNGVETRCAFLDSNVVEWAWRLPFDWKLNGMQNEKFILKHAFGAALPPRITEKIKQPYRAPDAIAFLHTARRPDYLDLVLSDTELKSFGLLDAGFARKLIDKIVRSPASNISHRENQTFIFLLSLLLLRKTMMQDRHRFDANSIEPILVNKINGNVAA